jgi:hypothetical protein
MESWHWNMVSILFGIFQFIVAVVGFCVIKFNDFKHLEVRMTKHEDSHTTMETKLDERHEKLVQSISNLAVEVAYLTGRKQYNKE